MLACSGLGAGFRWDLIAKDKGIGSVKLVFVDTASSGTVTRQPATKQFLGNAEGQ